MNININQIPFAVEDFLKFYNKRALAEFILDWLI